MKTVASKGNAIYLFFITVVLKISLLCFCILAGLVETSLLVFFIHNLISFYINSNIM